MDLGTVVVILCRYCSRDVTNAKLVRSPQGHYYCEECCIAAAKRKAQQPVAVSRGKKQKTAREVEAELLDVPVGMVEICPNCGEELNSQGCRCEVFGRSKKRGRAVAEEVEELQEVEERPAKRAKKRAARKAKAASDEGDFGDKAGQWVGTMIKLAFVLVVLGAFGFMGYGGWLMFHPPGAFDDYPTMRSEAVTQILSNISQGTDEGYEKAFRLISLRVRTTPNKNEDVLYKNKFILMHDDFLRKYGSDWLAKAKIESDDPGSVAEIVVFTVTLQGDVYHVLTQAQMSLDASFERGVGDSSLAENGKRHFGIEEIYEYTIHPPKKEKPIPVPGFMQMNGDLFNKQ